MSSIIDHDSEKKASSLDDNVIIESHEVSSININKGDEALRIIGVERTAQFSEEYNLKLRRKLVRPPCCLSACISQNVLRTY
jgi:hypothetical protein